MRQLWKHIDEQARLLIKLQPFQNRQKKKDDFSIITISCHHIRKKWSWKIIFTFLTFIIDEFKYISFYC